jgi:hypothetical protein
MKSPRSLLIGLTVASLLGFSGSAVATAPPRGLGADAAALAVPDHPTGIRFLGSDHIVAAGRTVHVRGQVIGRAGDRRGALAGAVVKLYRQFDGNSAWVYLGSQRTTDGVFPQFNFATLGRMNAHFRVVYSGNATFTSSEGASWVSIFRLFHPVITDGAGAATLHGHVDPYYNHKPIALQKRSCATCRYVTVKRTTTGMAGAYSFSLPAPLHGRWWWRASIPGTVNFIASYGGAFSTHLI